MSEQWRLVTSLHGCMGLEESRWLPQTLELIVTSDGDEPQVVHRKGWLRFAHNPESGAIDIIKIAVYPGLHRLGIGTRLLGRLCELVDPLEVYVGELTDDGRAFFDAFKAQNPDLVERHGLEYAEEYEFIRQVVPHLTTGHIAQ